MFSKLLCCQATEEFSTLGGMGNKKNLFLAFLAMQAALALVVFGTPEARAGSPVSEACADGGAHLRQLINANRGQRGLPTCPSGRGPIPMPFARDKCGLSSAINQHFLEANGCGPVYSHQVSDLCGNGAAPGFRHSFIYCDGHLVDNTVAQLSRPSGTRAGQIYDSLRTEGCCRVGPGDVDAIAEVYQARPRSFRFPQLSTSTDLPYDLDWTTEELFPNGRPLPRSRAQLPTKPAGAPRIGTRVNAFDAVETGIGVVGATVGYGMELYDNFTFYCENPEAATLDPTVDSILWTDFSLIPGLGQVVSIQRSGWMNAVRKEKRQRDYDSWFKQNSGCVYSAGDTVKAKTFPISSLWDRNYDLWRFHAGNYRRLQGLRGRGLDFQLDRDSLQEAIRHYAGWTDD